MIKDYVTYEEFGAVGDGIADDFLPIYKAHEYANEHKLPVKADETKHYRIHLSFVGEGDERKPQSITIKTDVYWGKAKFTIDDSDINHFDPWYMSMAKIPVFTVPADHESQVITDREILDGIVERGIEPGTKNIDLGFKHDYPVMIIPVNDKHKVFRRSGPYTPAQDVNRSELIVLDKDGNVSEETPIMFDYKYLSQVTVYRIDDKPITIDGGIITTDACRVNALPEFMPDGTPNTEKRNVGYFSRGLYVTRSNVTVQNMEHYVTGEVHLLDHVKGYMGPAYAGFYYAAFANHVKFKNCIITARRKFLQGTYEIAGLYANKLVFEGCKQTNFWIKIDENYNIYNAEEGEEGAMPNYGFHFKVEGTDILYVLWGCGGTNFCKNLEYIDSRLSRFDAHQGLYHGKIINSEISGMEITGYGDMIIENSRLFANSSCATFNNLLHLRGDYGYIWNGEIKIKDTELYVYTDSDGRSQHDDPTVLNDGWLNWYFGYETAFPDISIENLKLFDMKTLKPLADDYVLKLAIGNYQRQHLAEAHTNPRYQIVDRDGDGFVDDPIDYDKPLIFEGKPITVEEAMKRPDGVSYKYCITDGTTTRNINKKAPPRHIKLVDSNIRIAVSKTDGKGIPNGAYYGVAEDGDGGFFGCTKFYYEKDKFLQGTGEDTSGIENCPFVFN